MNETIENHGLDFTVVREKIVAAAVILNKKLILTMPPPARHADILGEFFTITHKAYSEGQGFLTSKGRFVRRTEAAEIAQHQLRNKLISPPLLFSEDLW